ncbi:MAG: hypothetical protein JXR90_11445 [Spirochaetes bacterium]|nr:hypothetical protein [Spirochaetota bacterium]
MSRLIGEIIERKKAEDEIKRQLSAKETLLKEVHHRIKNSITQVEGLLSLQADSTGNDNVKDALNEAISRVRSIRTLYEKLLIGKGYKSVSIKNYIESLVESLESIYSYKQTIKIENDK